MTNHMNNATVGTTARRPPLHVLVGRNSHGEWVVRERYARCGGFFSNRTEALRFAFGERGEAAGAVVLVPAPLELFEAPVSAAPSLAGRTSSGAASRRVLEEV